VMAGALKRASPDQHEEITLLCALNDSNLPKFLAADAVLFAGILSDLFPGVSLPVRDYGIMVDVIQEILLERKMQIMDCQIRKVIQLHETMIVRWGVMLVGPTGGSKTVVLHVLGDTYTRLCESEVPGQQYQIVHKYIMNPKSLSIGELYGEVNLQTLEWHDGILPLSLRTAVQSETTDHQWLICDGPVDAVWIENMNTVLDDNKMLCLSNSERIKLTPYVHMVFEEVIELRLDKRPRKAIGAPLGKKVVIFIDDVNMPRLDVYGAQPTIELLRQFLDFGGLYDRDKLYWKEILDVVLSCACAPPGGGRNPLTARFVRHFAMFYISAPNSEAMKTIFKAILAGHMEDFVTEVSVLGEPIVNAAVEVYLKICAELLPTPAKSHYVFNLRDLSKSMQGVLQANAAYMRAPQGMLR
ncbi:jg2424, partial [Pararge aegeria aegeria]